MKKLHIALTVFILFCLSFDAASQHIITLRTGEEIEAKVVQIGNSKIKYKKTSDSDVNKTYSVKKTEVFSVKFESGRKIVFDNSSDDSYSGEETSEEDWNYEPSYDKYGVAAGVGFEIGGGGLLGLIFRHRIGQVAYFESGLHYRPILGIDEAKQVSIVGRSLMLAGGFDFVTSKRYKAHKKKIKYNGMFVKGGHGFSSFTENFVAAGWYNETFHKDRFSNSIQFELGLGVLSSPWVNDTTKARMFEDVEKNGLMIYWKVSWNMYN